MLRIPERDLDAPEQKGAGAESVEGRECNELSSCFWSPALGWRRAGSGVQTDVAPAGAVGLGGALLQTII